MRGRPSGTVWHSGCDYCSSRNSSTASCGNSKCPNRVRRCCGSDRYQFFHVTNKGTQYPEYTSPPSKIGKTLGPLPGAPSKNPPALLLSHFSQTHDAFSVSHASSARLSQGTGCIEDGELRAAVGAREKPGQEQVAVGAEGPQCQLDQSPSPTASGVPSPVAVPVPRSFSVSVHAATFAQEGSS